MVVFRNGAIEQDVRISVFQDAQLDSEILNVALLALLSTLLSYQLSAICYNIFFGTKAKGRTAASDIHKLILTEASSPLSIFAAIARVDLLDRLRFKGDLPRNVKIARRDTHVKKTVVLSLIVLLLIAPVFNLISIFLVLQRDEMLTFGDTNFGGVALGVGKSGQDSGVKFQPFTPDCNRIPLRVVGPASSVVQFAVCLAFEITLDSEGLIGEEIRITTETTFQGQVKVSVISLPSNIPISIAAVFDMTTEGKLFRVQPTLSVESAIELLHEGQDRLALHCDSANRTNSPRIESLVNTTASNGVIIASKDFANCSLPTIREFIDVVFNMTERIDLIEQPGINVVDVNTLAQGADSPPGYFDAGLFRFIVRRSRNVNLLLLVVLLAAAILIRLITSFLFNNDIDEAMEAVVRYRLGVHERDSMLRSTRSVRYNSKGQRGGTAHYGLQRRSVPEVEQFEGGIEIGMEESSTALRSRDEW